MEQSGTAVSTAVTFRAGGSLSVSLPSFTINDDLVALETDETYPLEFTGHDYTAYPNRVQLGDPTDIVIFDNDSKSYNQINAMYSD